ncbi:MAG: hypothetical protein MJ101_00900 [Clostridia bacterium]|nr:hypothetical protein [Clostridia bacterium]
MDRLPYKKARWIWENDAPQPDEYAEFAVSFRATAGKKQTFLISADSDYTLYINGVLAGFGQYACYPDDKYGDELDITPHVRDGDNDVLLTVWYEGVDFMTYTKGKAGVRFEVLQDGETLAYSDASTPSRRAPGYIPHQKLKITAQLGLTFAYDAQNPGDDVPYTDSALTDLPETVAKRPIKKVQMLDRAFSRRVLGGTFSLSQNTGSIPEDMAEAGLRFRRAFREETPGGPFAVMNKGGDGVWFVTELQNEESGFLDFDLTVPDDCTVWIAYGEHLTDGRVRTYKRNFTCEYRAKAGRNTFINTFRRFGCRYLQFFVFSSEVRVDYAGIRPTDYPLTVQNERLHTGDLLRDTIIDTCVRTLKLCMHEHYEDCPWREQALYAMDSRNQALAGYYAFGETEFPRASFRLMSSHPRADGLLSLCAPGGTDAPIPSFSCAYFLEMDDYIRYSGDTTLAAECYDTMEKLMETFLSRRDETGAVMNFYAEENSEYWNFYEWAETLDGRFGETEPSLEAPLNAFVSLALQSFSRVCSALGKDEKAGYYTQQSRAVNEAIVRCFYREKDGLFDSFADRAAGKYSVLTNSLCVLCGAFDGLDTSVAERIMASNGAADTGLYVIPNTISMNIYRFDAMLRIDREKYGRAILDEIDRVYLQMLRAGATTFWETLKGEADFDTVGSLCHGWSALPIYYYCTLR